MFIDDPLIQQAAREQTEIGWNLFLCGRISRKWREAQDRWLDRLYTRWKSNGSTWAAKLCTKCINFHHSLWDHRNDILHSYDQLWKVEEQKARILEMEDLRVQLSAFNLHRDDQYILNQDVPPDCMKDSSQMDWLLSANQILARHKDRRTQTTLRAWVTQ